MEEKILLSSTQFTSLCVSNLLSFRMNLCFDFRNQRPSEPNQQSSFGRKQSEPIEASSRRRMSQAADVQARGNQLIQQYEEIEKEQKTLQAALQQVQGQILESSSVAEELDLLDADAEVFKALGPVLVKMEVADAVATVKQRLERYKAEAERLTKTYQEKDEKKGKLEQEVTKLQSDFASLQKKQQQQEQG